MGAEEAPSASTLHARVLPSNGFRYLFPQPCYWVYDSLRRMYIINNEICSRLVCKEHEVMKGKMTSSCFVGRDSDERGKWRHEPDGSKAWLWRRALGHPLNFHQSLHHEVLLNKLSK